MAIHFLDRADLEPYLDDVQFEFRENVFRVLEKNATLEYLRECDEKKRFPEELVQAAADQGWFAITLPEEHGGIGSYMDMVAFLEVVGYFSTSLARFWNITVNMVGGAIAAIGSEALKQELLPKVAEGKTFFAFALSENGSGSDAAALRTTGTLDGDDIVLSGTKMWITGALRADYILTACRTAKMENKQEGITLVLVPKSTPGLEINPIDLLGGHAIRTCEVNLVDVRVPQSLIVGDLHFGWSQLLGVLAKERVALASICTGAMGAAFDMASEYAGDRKQFGKAIGSFQAIGHKLADMRALADACRLLTFRAARILAAGKPCGREASIAKFFCADAYLKIATEGLQIMGANGYSMEYAMQRHFRESKLFQIFGGTNEIQRIIVSRDLWR